MLISRKYEVESLLGKGSMGEVYKVRHVTLGSISALKVLPSKLMDNPDLLTRFYREARVMAKLIHPNIVRVIDIDHDDELNFHYFVMEYIQGRTLRDYLQEKKILSLKEILMIAHQVAHALQIAHDHDPPVIHRDIKPANIMIENKSGRALLMDFGIAKELDDADMTRSGIMLGTVRYCPREQMLNDTLDGSADIYALGMVMYEAYTGKHLYSGLSENQIISKVLSDQEDKPEFDPSTPSEFAELITRSIAKTREKRYKRVADFISDLEKCWSRHVDNQQLKNIIESGSDNITDLDEHIQMLEKEKQRRLALSHSGKSQEAKEKAIQEDAEHLAEALYLEGCRLESDGNGYLNQEKYSHAQEAFLAATNLFSEAFLKASVIRLQKQAENIKHQVQTVRIEADNCNAKEKARTLYMRALNFQSQAEDFLDKSSFEEACENFNEAFRSYQDACELANFKSLKEDAEALSVQAKEAYDEAVKVEAEELAPTLFREAFAIEQQAKSALSSDDLAQANELYRVAIENYSLARQEVLDQRKRLDMLKARKQALEVWHRAKRAGAEQRFSAEFAEALQLKEQAQNWETQHKLDQAIEDYEKATKAFDKLRHEAELLDARDQAEIMKHQLAETKVQFDALRAWAVDAWTKADALTEEAETLWNRQHYLQALKLFTQALEFYAQAQQKAIAEQCNEQAQLILAQLQENQRMADHCEVGLHCREIYQQALDAKSEGLTRLNNHLCPDALTCFDKAKEFFKQAIMQRHQQLKQEISLTRQQADDSQVQTYAAAVFQQGLDLAAKAEVLWEQASYDQSYDCYREASRLFNNAGEFARRSFQKEEAKFIQVQVQKAYNEAVVADSQQMASAVFEDAKQSEKQADAAFIKEDFVQAKELYGSAINLYVIASQQGIEKKKELVALARQQAIESQERAHQAGADPEQESYKQAAHFYQSGMEHLDQLAYKQALSAFESAHANYQQAQREAEDEHKYQSMLVAKKNSEEEYRNAQQAESAHYLKEEFANASHLLEQAQHFETVKEFDKATELYEGAAKKFVQISLETAIQKSLRNLEENSRRVLTIEKEVKPLKGHVKDIWNEAQKLKIQAEKEAKAKNYNRAIELYEETYALYGRAKIKAESEQEELRRAKEEKIIRASKEVKNWWLVAALPAINRGLVMVLFVWLVAIGVYEVFNSSYVKKISLYFSPQTKITISKVTPMDTELSLKDGQTQTFSIEVQDKDKHPLDYTWFLDGTEQAKGEKWNYTPVGNGKGVSEVKVIITDGKQYHSEKVWKVKIAPSPVENKVVAFHHPPSIVSVAPSEQKLALSKGETVNFSVEAADDDANDTLTYAWFLDGQKKSSEKQWPFTTQAEGESTVLLKVSDQAGLEEQRTWRITTRLPENHPPRIVEAQPASKQVALQQGEAVNFSAQAADDDAKDSVTYAWFLDGQKKSGKKQWRYTAQAEGESTVLLKVSDQAGLEEQRTWRITTRLPENHPPRIVEAQPASKQVALQQGETVNFSAQAADDDAKDSVTYAWFLDGQKKSGKKQWRYTAQAEGESTVLLKVSDRAGLEDQRSWRVSTSRPPENHPPRIVEAQPASEQVALQQGETVNFSVQATDDDPDDSLTYAWSLDRQKKSNAALWSYTAQTEGKHAVTLTILDRKGLQIRRNWTVDVKPMPVKAAVEQQNEAILKSSHPKNAGPDTALSEAEVKKWLETNRIHWENKDVRMLVEMNTVDSGNAPKLQETLQEYKNFHVAFKNIKIDIEGTQATVSFTRVDTIEDDTYTHPDRKVIILEKKPDGRLIVKR